MSRDLITTDGRSFLTNCLLRRFNLPLSSERERHELFTLLVDWSGGETCGFGIFVQLSLVPSYSNKAELVACLPHVGLSAPIMARAY